MSVYTEHLEKLGKASREIDTGKATDNSFVDFQRLEAAIISAHANGYYNYDRYKHLVAIAAQLHEDFREALRLNESIRKIEKEIRKQRREQGK